MLRQLLLALILAGAAFLTRPTEVQVGAKVEARLRAAIEAGQARAGADPAQVLLFAACQANAEACADLIGAMVRIRYTDLRLFARVEIDGLARTRTCYAAFTRLICPGGLED